MKDDHVFTIVTDRSITLRDYLEIILSLNEAYKSQGHKLYLSRKFNFEVTFSEYEEEMHKTPFSIYLPKAEVYNVISDYVKPGKKEEIRQELDRLFPVEREWIDSFPREGVLSFFINYHIDDFLSPR